jgi:2-succinyl-6-hydroxy-2,4-cyclohexadiene-1-carboxylate synthase
MRVAFIHGFVGAPDVWVDVRVPNIEARYVTLPGHGIDPVGPTWDENLEIVATAVGVVDCVVGYSLGARVALGLVANRKAPRAILVSVNPGLDNEQREPRRVGDAAWAAMLRERGIEHFLAAWEAQPLFASQERVDEKRKLARRARRMALVPEQLARSLEVMGLAEMPDYRSAIHSGLDDDRVALVTGADDGKYTAIAMTFAVKHEVIAEAGHDPSFEQPAALAAAIARLL